MDSKPLTQEEIIKIYKEAFGKGDQLVTIDRIFRFARLLEHANGIKNASN